MQSVRMFGTWLYLTNSSEHLLSLSKNIIAEGCQARDLHQCIHAPCQHKPESLILVCMQGFVKQHLGASVVSQRDLQRAFKFIDFFLAHHRARQVQLDDKRLMHQCLLLSVAMTYYLRLPAANANPGQSSLRQRFCQMMAELQPPAEYYRVHADPWDNFEDVVADELQQYITGAQLPPGIAANLALMENLAVCHDFVGKLAMLCLLYSCLHADQDASHHCGNPRYGTAPCICWQQRLA